MKKFEGTMIVTDLDGTFASNITLCGENEKYVMEFQSEGGLFTVATGRYPGHIGNLIGFKANCPVVSHNGAVVWDYTKNKAIYSRKLCKDIAEVIDFTVKGGYASRADMNSLEHTDACTEYSLLPENTDYYKAVFCCESKSVTEELQTALISKFSERFCIFKSWDTGVEVLPKDTNKGTAVKWLREYLGDRVKRLICVGDHENDSFMLKYADIGYAVKNASAQALAACDRVTVNYKDGYVKYILDEI